MKKLLTTIMAALIIIGFSRITFIEDKEKAKINVIEYLMYIEDWDTTIDPMLEAITILQETVNKKWVNPDAEWYEAIIQWISNLFTFIVNIAKALIEIILTPIRLIIYPILIILKILGLHVDPKYMRIYE